MAPTASKTSTKPPPSKFQRTNKRVAGELYREYKYFDVAAELALYPTDGEANGSEPHTGMPASSAGFMVCLNTIEGGANAEQRIGRDVQNKSITATYQLVNSHFIGMSSVTVMLVEDKQANGQFLKYTDLFTNKFVAANVNDHRNLGYSTRFRILKSKSYTLDPDVNATQVAVPATGYYAAYAGNSYAVTSVPCCVQDSLATKLSTTSHYTQTAAIVPADYAYYFIVVGTPANPSQNGLYVPLTSDVVVPYGKNCGVSFQTRIRFTDS